LRAVSRTWRGRFAALRIRPAHRDEKRSQPWPEEWLLIEWLEGEAGPSKYWLATLHRIIAIALARKLRRCPCCLQAIRL